MDIGSSWTSNVQVTIAAITVIAGVIVYLFQRRQNTNNRFNMCASSLQKDSEEAQITAAILLRSFLNKWYYKTDALNLISALLRVTPYGNLQKTLGDGLAYVKRANGQDFQYTDLHRVSIKSRNRVKYEVTKFFWHKRRQQFRGADFFRSDITDSSIYNVNFNKAVFYDALLYKTVFHDCTFYGASFKDADLTGVTFDQCKLKGVDFSGALHIDTVTVQSIERIKSRTVEGKGVKRIISWVRCVGEDFALLFKKGNKKEKRRLLHFLDEKGIYGKYHREIVFKPSVKTTSVFISHLGMMDSTQTTAMRDISGWLKDNLHLKLVDIARKNYRDSGQLKAIQNAMEKSCGVVILAFSYVKVSAGTIHEIKGNKVCDISDTSFSSPWLQIEAAIARSMGLPCLVFVEKGVLQNGFFDEKLVRNDGGMYMVEYSDSTVTFSSNDKRKIRDWRKKVELLKNAKKK